MRRFWILAVDLAQESEKKLCRAVLYPKIHIMVPPLEQHNQTKIKELVLARPSFNHPAALDMI